MPLLMKLPVELLLAIVQTSDTVSTLNSIARTCRHLNAIFSPILHRRALRETKHGWAWAIDRDRSDVCERILAHQTAPRWIFRAHELNLCLLEALKSGSFRVANLLLDAGAEVLYSAGARRRPDCHETEAWLAARPHLYHGSLALAARSRYHLTFWYRSVQPHTSEVEYWKWKKRAMEKILRRLRTNFDQSYAECPEVSYAEYQRELDVALVEAASSDAHSIELMGFLLAAGADVNADVNVVHSQVVGQVWRSALDEEVPSLFRAKVGFLMKHDVEATTVWTLEGVQAPIEFLLRKMEWAHMYSGDVSFVDRVLYFTEILESYGCLQWPQVKFEHSPAENGSLPGVQFHDLNEPGARQLQTIFSDQDERLDSLRKALRIHLSRKQLRNCAEKPVVVQPRPDVDTAQETRRFHAQRLQLPQGIEILELLHETWINGRGFVDVIEELMAVRLVCRSRRV